MIGRSSSQPASGTLDGVAFRLTAPGRIERVAVSIDAHALAARQVAIVAEYSAISPGTELAAWRGDPPLRSGPVYPRRVGYSHVGRVVGIGSDVTKARLGDRVFTFTEHCSVAAVAEDEIVAVIDERLAGPVAALAYLYHLGYAALLRAGITAGHDVAVIGCGALGLATIAVANAAGAKVAAFSEREQGLSLARRAGTELVSRLGETPAAAEAARKRYDIVVTTSNRWSDWRVALQLARKGGTVAVIGFPGRGQGPAPFNPLDSQFFYDKQLAIVGTGQAPEVDVAPDVARFTLSRNMKWLLDRLAAGGMAADVLAGEIKPASEIEAVYRDLAERRITAPTVVLDWQ